MYPDPITPRAHPELLSRVDYDPFNAMPAALPSSPRVFATAAQIERARRRVAAGVVADVHGLEQLIASCRLDEPLPAYKDNGGPPDWGGPLLPWLNLAFRNALAGLLTDDRRHRLRALEAMRLAAEAVSRISRWTGHESNEAMAAARAYDLLTAGGLAPADDNALRGMLWTLAEALNHAGHRYCNNHNVMNMAGRLSLAAAAGHRQWIHDVLYGCQSGGHWRYGLIHALRHDLLADGMQWEGSVGYHQLVLGLICECLCIMENLGVNLWTRAWPATLKDEGFDEHRGWGPKGDKPLTSAFDALLYQAFPNGDYSMLHDSLARNLRGTGCWWRLFNKAWEVYGEPRYAWALKLINGGTAARADGPVPVWFQGQQGSVEFARIESRDLPDGENPLVSDRRFALSGSHASGCSLFPAHGSAVLRGDPGNERAPGAYLYWGPHSAGHRSPAALHLDIHAFGRLITRSPVVSIGYADQRHLTWNRTTIAHNTVTVDETPMFPYDFEGDSIWEYDLWRDSISDGSLEAFQPEAGFKAVRAANDNVYPGVRLDRAILLTDGYLLDVYRVDADRERRLDWAMHGAADVDFDGGDAIPVALGSRRGYEHFTGPLRHAVSSGWAHLPFQAGTDRAQVSLWMDGAPGACLVTACDPVPKAKPGETVAPPNRSTLILRTRAASATFIALWSFGRAPAEAGEVRRTPDGSIEIAVRADGQSRTWQLSSRFHCACNGERDDCGE